MIPPAAVAIGPSPPKVLGSVAIASVAILVGATILVVFFEFLAAVGLSGHLAVPPWLWSHRWIIIACTAALVAGGRGRLNESSRPPAILDLAE